MGSLHQRGLTIAELLVGVAVGLLVTAAATTLVFGHIREYRALWVQSRLMQDLRVAADVITRDLRRAGYGGDHATRGVYPYAAVTPASAPSDEARFAYSLELPVHPGVDSTEEFGFRLRHGAIEMMLGRNNWQALTDPGTVVITGFSVTPGVHEIALQGFCARPCPDDAGTCAPKQVVRSLAVAISGHAVSDTGIVRTVQHQVRLRNDTIVGACPA